jgi:integrase
MWPKVGHSGVIVAFRKHASYIRKGRAGYQLQRGVPKALQGHLGRTQWKEPGGATLREAQARVSGFLARTDQLIAEARGEDRLSTEEVIDLIPKAFRLDTKHEVEDLVLGIEILRVNGAYTNDQADRAIRIARGQEDPRKFLTASELIEIGTRLKDPAPRTKEKWEDALGKFLEFAKLAHPTAATREHAIAFRGHLLERQAISTVKSTFASLAGLWSLMVEINPMQEHIFKGLTKRLKVRPASEMQRMTEAENFKSPELWEGNPHHILIFRAIMLTGCRAGEIYGLCAEDVRSDRLLIRPRTDRTIKTPASSRAIPLHPKLEDLKAYAEGRSGPLWPNLRNGNRWGVNMAKPCKRITGVEPKALRHRAATTLREAGFNEAVIGRLLGHSSTTITGSYGSVPWDRLVEAVAALG